MNIIFKTVHLKNFMSFRDAYVELEDKGFVLIEGVNNNILDNAKSNGAGKSTICESIVWALTGETIRSAKNVNNLNGDGEGCFVELLMTVDGDEYKVVRYKEHIQFKNNLKLYVNGKDVSGKGLTETEKILQSHLPDITIQFLGSVIVLGQGLPQRFTNNTPSGRKEILENLSKSDFMIEDIKQRLTNRKVDLQTNISNFNGTLNGLNSTVAIQRKALEENTKQIAYYENYNNVEIVDHLNISIKNTQEEMDSTNKKVCDIQNDIDSINLEIEGFTNKLNEFRDMESSAYSLYEVSMSELSQFDNVTIALDVNITNINKEIQKLENVQTVCPTCGRPFEDIFKPDTTDLKNKLQIYEQEKETRLQERNILFSAVERHKQDIKVIKANYATAQQNIKSLNSTKQDRSHSLNNFKSYISSDLTLRLNRLKEDLQKEKLEATKTQIKIETLQNTNKDIKKCISDCESQITDIQQKVSNLDQHLECVTKLLGYCSRDFRGYLLEDCINYIAGRVKFYSNIMFSNECVDFILDNNSIRIKFCDKDYENLSGGERQKIDLIVQFSLRDMLISTIGFSCNLLAIDEGTDGLDSVGCGRLIDMITTTLQDVSTVFIVSHHNDIPIPCDNRLVVTKLSEGYSVLERPIL